MRTVYLVYVHISASSGCVSTLTQLVHVYMCAHDISPSEQYYPIWGGIHQYCNMPSRTPILANAGYEGTELVVGGYEHIVQYVHIG